jgi:hypothetical protein
MFTAIMWEDLAVCPVKEGLTITVVYSPGFGSYSPAQNN